GSRAERPPPPCHCPCLGSYAPSSRLAHRRPSGRSKWRTTRRVPRPRGRKSPGRPAATTPGSTTATRTTRKPRPLAQTSPGRPVATTPGSTTATRTARNPRPLAQTTPGRSMPMIPGSTMAPPNGRRLVLGIDLGTTNTCVAIVGDDPAGRVLPNAEGKLTTPSVVFFGEDGTAAVGERAMAEVERDPGRVVTLIKRQMGRASYTVEAGGRRWYPQQVSAVILRKVVEDALAHLGRTVPPERPVADAVIAVPAYFGTAERKATMDAGNL